MGAVESPVPVGYETLVGALLLEGGFVEGEEVAVPGEEGGDEVDCDSWYQWGGMVSLRDQVDLPSLSTCWCT